MFQLFSMNYFDFCRACPECRVKSDFVTPSKYWVEDKQEKEKLIIGYKQALRSVLYYDIGQYIKLTPILPSKFI